MVRRMAVSVAMTGSNDGGNPDIATLRRRRVNVLGSPSTAPTHVLANTLAATAPARACRHVSSMWVIIPSGSTSIHTGHAPEFLDRH